MIVSAKAIRPIFAVAAKIAPTRLGAMYASLLLRENNGCQEVVATDATTVMVASFPVEGAPITTAVNARFFASLLGLYDEPVEIFATGSRTPALTVRPVASKQISQVRAFSPHDIHMVDLPPADALAAAGYTLFTEVPGEGMHDYIARLGSTIDKDGYQYITFTGDVVQTFNQYALTYRDIDLERTVLRIPVDAFLLLKPLMSAADTIQVWHNGTRVIFVGPTFRLGTALGNGNVVDTGQYKTGQDAMVTVAAADLRAVVQIANGAPGYLQFDVDAQEIVVALYSPNQTGDPDDVPAYRMTIAHTTPPDKVKPFTVRVTAPVIRPIVNGLGHAHVAFGRRATPEKGLVGMIIADGYAQLFAQAVPPTKA